MLPDLGVPIAAARVEGDDNNDGVVGVAVVVRNMDVGGVERSGEFGFVGGENIAENNPAAPRCCWPRSRSPVNPIGVEWDRVCLAGATRESRVPASADIVESRLGEDSLLGVREDWPVAVEGRRRVLS